MGVRVPLLAQPDPKGSSQFVVGSAREPIKHRRLAAAAGNFRIRGRRSVWISGIEEVATWSVSHVRASAAPIEAAGAIEAMQGFFAAIELVELRRSCSKNATAMAL